MHKKIKRDINCSSKESEKELQGSSARIIWLQVKHACFLPHNTAPKTNKSCYLCNFGNYEPTARQSQDIICGFRLWPKHDPSVSGLVRVCESHCDLECCLHNAVLAEDGSCLPTANNRVCPVCATTAGQTRHPGVSAVVREIAGLSNTADNKQL